MASWKKVIVSGSDANLRNLVVSQSLSAISITGSLLGSAQSAEMVVINSDTAPTGSLSGSLWFNTDNLTLYVRYTDPSGSTYWVASFNAGLPVTSSYSISSSLADSAKTASYFNTSTLATTGSNTFTGNQIISGTLFITGVTTLGGDIVPATAQGATLGTVDKPFREIFVSSGSINIESDVSGSPNTSISNIEGNLLISAGGMRLVGSASFVAATGSFGYISGSVTQVGDYNMIGNKTITGSLNVSGSINGNFTGSLLGTATTASYVQTAQTASRVTGSNVIGIVSQAYTSSYVIPYEGAWTSYTPSWTAASVNPAIGNGTAEGYYKVIGKTCFVRGNIVMGSTTTFGTGEWYVSMPLTASHADAILMTVTLLDNGSNWYNATMAGARAGFSHKAPIQYQGAGGHADDVNLSKPFNWATSDRFIWNGSYEIL